MNKVNLYKRYLLKNSLMYSQFFQVQHLSSKKEEENENRSMSDRKTNKEALDKLNLLLKQIVQDDRVHITSNLKLAKPSAKKTTLRENETEDVKTHSIDTNVISSVKRVAKTLSGNVKQTESELLSKLLNSDNENTESKPSSTNLSDIVKGMKIDKNKQAAEYLSRAQQVRSILKESKGTDNIQPKSLKIRLTNIQNDSRDKTKMSLFGKEFLKIFSDINQYTESETNKTWQKLHDRELRLAVTHPPTNYFQQMILWTEQGKIWNFSIDNEQGMEEEHNVSFTEHVFLEKYLENWCSSKGPVRHFMELVCVGLSKNPYMSSKCKQEHIEWYKNYFQDKSKLLEEVGAIPSDVQQTIEQVATKDVKD